MSDAKLMYIMSKMASWFATITNKKLTHNNFSSTIWNCNLDNFLLVSDSPTSLSNYLACKQRGVTGAKRGAIKWAINRDVTFGEGKSLSTKVVCYSRPSFSTLLKLGHVQLQLNCVWTRCSNKVIPETTCTCTVSVKR